MHGPLKGRVRRVDLQAQARASELGFNFFSFKIMDDLLSDPIFFEKKKADDTSPVEIDNV